MSTQADFIEYIHEQAGLGSRLTRRKMFGGYALYLDSKVVALICNNSLFIKPVEATQALTKGLPQQPPYPGAKLYPMADELLDDSERLQALLLATAAELPLPKPKRPKRKKND